MAVMLLGYCATDLTEQQLVLSAPSWTHSIEQHAMTATMSPVSDRPGPAD